MIITMTAIQCDKCGDSVTLLHEDNATRQMTAISMAAERGWVRTHGDRNRLVDICPACVGVTRQFQIAAEIEADTPITVGVSPKPGIRFDRMVIHPTAMVDILAWA